MKADLAFELTRAWKVLRDDPERPQHGRDVNVLGLEAPGFPFPAWAGIGDGRQATFLIETQARPELPVADSDVLDISFEALHARGRMRTFVSLACNRSELEPVFAELCSDLARRVSSGCGIAAGVEASLAEFRSLLQKPREGIGEEQLIGLTGELIVLEQLLAHDGTAVAGWVGAKGTRHDFRSGSRAIEVKCSLRQQTRSISVNAVDQLLPPEGGDLFLAYVRLEHDPAGKEVLAGICQRIRQLCDPSQVELFDRHLASVIGNPLPRIAGNAYSVMEFSVYRVAGDFPALVPARFVTGRPDPGVSRISYEVDLSAAEDFRLSRDQWKQLLLEWH
jgi:hypothetical protein